MGTSGEPRSFTVHVPDGILRALRERLARTRWAEEAPGAGWRYGTDLAYLCAGSINASFWPYYHRMHRGWPLPEGRIDVPTGYAEFPREILHPPRAWAERAFDILGVRDVAVYDGSLEEWARDAACPMEEGAVGA